MNQHEINEFSQILGDKVENWLTRNMPHHLPLKGNYCLLEPINIKNHTEGLFESLAINNTGESWTYLPYGPFNNCNDFQKWLENTINEPDTLLYAILDSSTHKPVGIAGYLRINPEHGVIEVGHLHYSTLLKRTPAATEAMHLMMKHVFDLGYRRYEWKCNALNEASRKAALRLGFKFEGIFRQSNVYKGRNRDTAWFSILDSEWPAINERFQRWLNPSNFELNGNQINNLQKI